MGVSILFLVSNRAFFLPCSYLCRSLGADDGGCVLLRIDSGGLSVAPYVCASFPFVFPLSFPFLFFVVFPSSSVYHLLYASVCFACACALLAPTLWPCPANHKKCRLALHCPANHKKCRGPPHFGPALPCQPLHAIGHKTDKATDKDMDKDIDKATHKDTDTDTDKDTDQNHVLKPSENALSGDFWKARV